MLSSYKIMPNEYRKTGKAKKRETTYLIRSQENLPIDNTIAVEMHISNITSGNEVRTLEQFFDFIIWVFFQLHRAIVFLNRYCLV